MSTKLLQSLFLVALLAVFAEIPNASSAEWRWAKPLNQKPGSLLYTTNVRAKNRSSTRTYHQPTYQRPNYPVIQPRRLFSRGILFRR